MTFAIPSGVEESLVGINPRAYSAQQIVYASLLTDKRVHPFAMVQGEAAEERSLHSASLRSGRPEVGYDASIETKLRKQEWCTNAEGGS
jgi:hypothetical protein